MAMEDLIPEMLFRNPVNDVCVLHGLEHDLGDHSTAIRRLLRLNERAGDRSPGPFSHARLA
jgi:hypothetical protein